MSDRSSDEGRICVHVLVSGRVQGVYYRASTRDQARKLGVDGWVRNRSDGRVEAVFEGSAEAVEGMVEWCKTGSRAAEVDAVESTTEQLDGLDGFEVRW